MAKLSQILDQVDSETILLPEFQRGYVWNRDQVRGLLRSMYLGHPVGSLLLWETADPAVSARGSSAGAGTYQMLLDGQQRITSLYGVIKGKPPKFFDGDAKAFTGLYFNVDSQEFMFHSPTRMSGEPRWVDVTQLFAKGPARFFARLASEYGEDLAEAYLDRMNRLHQITEREFQQEKITGADRDVEEVVEIFNRVNSGGTKLSKGDLALAQVCAQWPDARKEMRAAIDRWEKRGYKFNLDWLLRTTMAVATGKARFEQLAKVGAEEFRDALERAVAHTDTFLEAVAGRLGLDHDRVLKSRASLIVAVRLLELNGGEFDDRSHRDKVLYWYMNSALWGRYSAMTESTLQKDFDTVARSGVDGLIATLERSRSGALAVRPHDFEGTQGTRFYPLLYLLMRSGSARDLVTGRELTSAALESGSQLQRQTLFPTALLRGHDAKADAIANFCFLADGDHLGIGQAAPEEYLGRIEAENPGVLASQWIPADPSLWRVERYRDFLAARREMLAEAAQTFLEGLREGTAPEEEELRPLTVVAEEAGDPRSVQVRTLVEELREAGYAEPELDTVISDPGSGRVIAEAEAFWAEGLQRGLGKPVVLELDPEQADLPRLQELGYEVFTSVEALSGFVRRSAQEASGTHPVEVPAEPVGSAGEEHDGGDNTEKAFHRAMVSVYERAKEEAGYTPSFFLGMLADLGALGTARKLLAAPAVSDGFSNLWERGRLDLTVEAVVLRPEFAELFTAEELDRARGRLEQFGYAFAG
ncbi:GmrSD restriction endonuclease domain-containing protein [Nocardiopsis algeriensis]|uniref:GmrSD restriction endonuclease domain-containing protein n=1 Tax=Nocardiopsis algeriensis TaxID=1478215 RepID=UPI003B4349BD